MRHLADTLQQVSLRAYRRWHVPDDTALHTDLRDHGMQFESEVREGDEARLTFDVALVRRLDALPESLPPHTQVFLLGDEALPQGWREWMRWPLDAEGALAGEDAATTLRLLLPTGYDFAAHARALLLARELGAAMELLLNVAYDFLRDNEERARVATERLLCMLPWDKAQGDTGRLNRLARAIDAFNMAATGLPHEPLAYELMGAFWERAGRSDLRLRLISTYATARHDAPQPIPEPPVSVSVLPPAPPTSFRPRILLLLHEASDYGTDALYDGLCAVMGDDQVLEFPWKPTLHGQAQERTMGYPCFFRRGGEAAELDEITAQLRAGDFDCVVYSDTLGMLDPALVARVARAGRELPWFVLDQWDQLGDYRAEIAARLGGVVPRAWFKREKLIGADYGPTTHALPFAYPEVYAGGPPAWEQREGVFWAGKPACGTRALVLEHLHNRCGIDTTAQLGQDAYRARLRSVLIGLSLFGNGFDTVRYWELPAHGVMLLAERPPIEIPNDFVDGESAVFFDDLAGLKERLHHYQLNPNEALRIAREGHAHWLRHHTHTARARQFLGWIAQYLH